MRFFTDSIKRIAIICALCFSISAVVLTGQSQAAENNTRPYDRIAIASDVHYITKKTDPDYREAKGAEKLAALDNINTWRDVDLVVFLGDLIEKHGTEADYANAKMFYDKCTQPKTIIMGNHEMMYDDIDTPKGSAKWGTPEKRAQRIQQFKEAFGQKDLYYTKEMKNYLLVFLAPDKVDPKFSIELSDEELAWLKNVLETNKTKPTIIFCHAPLKGTLDNYRKKVNKGNTIVHPAKKLEALLTSYPQIKLWVSGHTHTSYNLDCFANNETNMYMGKFLDIHNPTWEKEDICINSLYLYDDRIEIKTFDITENRDRQEFDRVVKIK